MILYLVFVFWFFLPAPAYAYLDPGTGNALVYVIVSFFGAMLFSLKGIFYKLIGKGSLLADERSDREKWHKIVIFSEGAIYWGTFRPIVEELLTRNIPFSYYTFDIGDPCLRLSRPNLNNRYIGSGHRAFAKLGHLQADIVLSTTPNIGTPGYPVPRSAGIKKLVYVYHAVDDMSDHHRGSLDHYDAVLLMGAFQTPIIRKLETLRGLPPKEVYPAGLPYLDELAKQQKAVRATSRIALVAPTWGEKSCLRNYGTDFIKKLVGAGFEIILRAHPYSWKVEPDFMQEIEQELSAYPGITWDKEINGTASMQKAALLVSDVSGVRFDFMLLQKKPVITLAISGSDMEDFEIFDLKESWIGKESAKFSRVLTSETIDSIAEVAEELIGSPFGENIEIFSRENIYNRGNSAKVIADYLIERANVR